VHLKQKNPVNNFPSAAPQNNTQIFERPHKTLEN
jgi:hypothetical protein